MNISHIPEVGMKASSLCIKATNERRLHYEKGEVVPSLFQRVSPETLEFSTKPPSERIFCSSPETDASKSVVSMETFAE